MATSASAVDAASNSTMVPLSEYLRTSYQPDCDWVDGELRERNVGEGSHGNVQGVLIAFFRNRAVEFGVRVWQEDRVQVSATRYRIPDVFLTRRSAPFEEIVRVPPLLCIEILSRDQPMSDLLERVADYFAMGVEANWVIDPWKRLAYRVDADGRLMPVTSELVVAGTPVRIAVAEIFAELDELQGRL